jgi:hypothetical protein
MTGDARKGAAVPGYEDYERMERYRTELTQLLATGGLSPDARARSLAALIENESSVHAMNLTEALRYFCEAAEELSAALRRPPMGGF